ncbi:MAG TPA: 3-oxoacyl-ACP reductase family protein [Anaerolineae bacterium]|nr:3-oxoacyl-ACP reductase family protein [Anaerolineae bacterium]
MTRVALVTGAAQGIGRAIALRLARDGFALALADWNAKQLPAVRDEIERAGGWALALTADLTQVAEIERVVQEAADSGPLSVLVNNAGRIIIRPFLQVTEADWDATLTLDLKTVFFAMQCAARRMERGARIVNIASVSGRGGRPDQAPYAAAKAGVISITRSAALALAPRGITVNAVCPGVVDTPMTREIHTERARLAGITPEESLTRMLSNVPLARLETPEDVAGAVSFLCSPDAAYITGQSLNVCGGMEMD